MTDTQALFSALGNTLQAGSFFQIAAWFGGGVMTIAALRVSGWF